MEGAPEHDRPGHEADSVVLVNGKGCKRGKREFPLAPSWVQDHCPTPCNSMESRSEGLKDVFSFGPTRFRTRGPIP